MHFCCLVRDINVRKMIDFTQPPWQNLEEVIILTNYRGPSVTYPHKRRSGIVRNKCMRV